MWMKEDFTNIRLISAVFVLYFIFGAIASISEAAVALSGLLRTHLYGVSVVILVEIFNCLILLIFIIAHLVKTERLYSRLAVIFVFWLAGPMMIILFEEPPNPELGLWFFLVCGLFLPIIIVMTRLIRNTEVLILTRELPSNKLCNMIRDMLSEMGINHKLTGPGARLDFKLKISDRHVADIRFYPFDENEESKERWQKIDYVIFDQDAQVFHSNIKQVLYDLLSRYEVQKNG